MAILLEMLKTKVRVHPLFSAGNKLIIVIFKMIPFFPSSVVVRNA